MFKLKVSLTFFYFWLGSAKEEEKRRTTKFSPLNASVALIKKPVNWFAQHSKSIDWFLYRGATLAFNGLNQTVVNMLFMLLKTFKTFFIRVLILQYPYDFEISELKICFSDREILANYWFCLWQKVSLFLRTLFHVACILNILLWNAVWFVYVHILYLAFWLFILNLVAKSIDLVLSSPK